MFFARQPTLVSYAHPIQKHLKTINFTYGIRKSSSYNFLLLSTLSTVKMTVIMPRRDALPVALSLTFGSQPRPQYSNQSYLQNGTSGPVPGAQPLLPNNGRIIQSGPTRVLCIADVRGEDFKTRCDWNWC